MAFFSNEKIVVIQLEKRVRRAAFIFYIIER